MFKINRVRLPFFVSLLIFILLIYISLTYNSYRKANFENNERNKLKEILISKKTQLEKSLYSRIFYTRGVSAFVSLNPDITDEEFYILAEEYIKGDTVISSMALSKNCVLNAIYPHEGHEEAIGLNLMEHPERREIVERTIKTRQTFVAGPVELVEGGIAFISYTPVFYKTFERDGDLWGITDIVIYKDKLLNESKLLVSERGYNFSLKGYNGKGENGDLFWGSEQVFNNNPEIVKIDLPNGTWILGSVPESGWKNISNTIYNGYIFTFSISLIICVFIFLLLRSYNKIRFNELELKAILGSMHNMIIEFDKNGIYKKIVTVDESIQCKPINKLLGNSVSDVFDAELSNTLLKAIQKCLSKKKLIVIEYKVVIDGEEKWCIARISFKTENSVIFNAYDVTNRKLNEIKLFESEKKLKKLNITKDKFFSLISHDLKAPFNALLGFSDMLAKQGDLYSPEQIKKIGTDLFNVSEKTYNLLLNLLDWSKTQTGSLKANFTEFFLLDVINETTSLMAGDIQLKKITISKKDILNEKVFADKSMIMTIARNLLSNAVKFCPEGSKIDIKTKDLGDKVRISVCDNGLGIKKDNIDKLFRIDSGIINNENGSGIGLIICKEFIEMNKGKIWVESEEGKGACFYFTVLKAV